eukprot:26678_1
MASSAKTLNILSSVCINLELVSLIETATCIQDLTPLLSKVVGLAEMKDILKQRVSTMDIQQKRDLYLKVSPMDDVLPQCIVQSVIGFNDDLRQIALVNKTFHKCCDSVQGLVLKKKKTDLQTEFNDLHSDFKDSRIIHVYPSTYHNALRLAVEHAQSGDTLLIHQGVYEFQEHYKLNKSIKLIGYGPNVLIKAEQKKGSSFGVDIIFGGYSFYVQNLSFDIDNESTLLVRACSFYIENCVFNYDWIAWAIAGGKTVKIKDCIIKGESVNFTQQ